MRKLLVILLVLAVAILAIVYFRKTEGFANVNTVTPLTKESVQELLDNMTLEYLAYYDSLVNLKSKDPRILNRIQMMASDINILNDQYPAITYRLEQTPFDYYKMVGLEDLKIIKDFITRKVGIIPSADLTKPADLADIDLVSNRLKSFFGFLQQKAPLVKMKLPDNASSLVRTMLENLLKLKLQVGSMKPEDVPVLKSDNYWIALNLAKSNFVAPPELLNKPPIQIKTENLPVPAAPLKELQKAIAKTDTKVATPASICPPATVCPPEKICPKCPPPEGRKYSELIKSLLIENALVAAVHRGAI